LIYLKRIKLVLTGSPGQNPGEVFVVKEVLTDPPR
jgi:hypothetical protein